MCIIHEQRPTPLLRFVHQYSKCLCCTTDSCAHHFNDCCSCTNLHNLDWFELHTRALIVNDPVKLNTACVLLSAIGHACVSRSHATVRWADPANIYTHAKACHNTAGINPAKTALTAAIAITHCIHDTNVRFPAFSYTCAHMAFPIDCNTVCSHVLQTACWTANLYTICSD